MNITLFANFLGSLLTLHLVHSFTDCYMYVASLLSSVSVCTLKCVWKIITNNTETKEPWSIITTTLCPERALFCFLPKRTLWKGKQCLWLELLWNLWQQRSHFTMKRSDPNGHFCWLKIAATWGYLCSPEFGHPLPRCDNQFNEIHYARLMILST